MTGKTKGITKLSQIGLQKIPGYRRIKPFGTTLAWKNKIKENFKVIYVTHGHPDDYLGLEILTKEFPEARVLSTKDVAAYIKNTGQNYIAQWKPIYKDDLADSFIVPQV
ncbi:MAG TPA: hypothetical protein VF360_07520 [Candidatus Methanoperedens sp.]